MPVNPTGFRANGDVDTHCSGCNATTVAPAASVTFGRFDDGSVDPRFIKLPCSACGAVTTHPVAGGSHPEMVQRLFARVILARAAALGIPAGQRQWDGIKARIKQMVADMDGPLRWRLEDVAAPDG